MAMLRMSLEQFVGRRGADVEASTQFTDVGIRLLREQDKFLAKTHDISR